MIFPEHITRKELELSQTAVRNDINNEIPTRLLPNAVRLAWFLETLREKLSLHFDRPTPVIISSGFRCVRLNASIGGSETSAHCRALAADITVPGMTTYELAMFIKNNMVEEGWDQLIHEFGAWVHIGLAEGRMRNQCLTAIKAGRKTVYRNDILEVA